MQTHNLFSDEHELNKLIIETANEGIWLIDEKNITVFVNQKMAEILNYSVEEMTGASLFDFMDEEARKKAIENLNQGKEDGANRHEFRFLTKDGKSIWTLLNTNPVIKNGTYRGALAMVTDISHSKQHELELKDSYFSYISLFEDSPVPIWDEDFSKIKDYIDKKKQEGVADFRAFFSENPDKLEECTSLLIVNNINQAVVDLNEAKSKKDVLENFRALLTRDSANYAIEQLVAIAENRTSCEFDAELLTFGGNIRYVHLKWSVVKGYENNYGRVYLSTTDMTERIIDENLSLQHSNREKAVLLKEIHHRVKNNLQIISSLLNLQSYVIEDPSMRDVFSMSLHRVKAMATVHELLYKSNDFSGIDYKEYLNRLIDTLVESMKGEINNIQVDITVDDIHLNINTSVPLGLLINEIITNSLKHGIEADKPGRIYVEIYADKSPNYTLKIGDYGKGIPKDFNISDTETLGLQLVTSLIDQLSGSIERDFTTHGTHYIIQFQELEQQSSI